MTRLQSLRSLLGQSRLLLLGALVLAVFVAVGFLDLAMNTAAARAQRDQELARVERLREQNIILQQELNRAQRDEHIAWQAWDYFGRVPPGTGVIESVEAQPVAAPAPEEPKGFWEGLLGRLGVN